MSGKLQIDIEEVIVKAVKEVGGSEGASLDGIERHLKSTLKTMPDLESIHLSLNKAVSKGLLLKLDNGKYKIKDTAEWAETTAKDANNDDKVLSKLRHEENDIKVARNVKEDAQEVERSIDKVAQDANRNKDSGLGYVGFLVSYEDDKNNKEKIKEKKQPEQSEAITQGPNIDDKVLSELQHENNEVKVVKRIKAVQEADSSADNVAQDANRNTDSDTHSTWLSVAKEEDAKASVPEDDDKNDKKMMKKKITKDK